MRHKLADARPRGGSVGRGGQSWCGTRGVAATHCGVSSRAAGLGAVECTGTQTQTGMHRHAGSSAHPLVASSLSIGPPQLQVKHGAKPGAHVRGCSGQPQDTPHQCTVRSCMPGLPLCQRMPTLHRSMQGRLLTDRIHTLSSPAEQRLQVLDRHAAPDMPHKQLAGGSCGNGVLPAAAAAAAASARGGPCRAAAAAVALAAVVGLHRHRWVQLRHKLPIHRCNGCRRIVGAVVVHESVPATEGGDAA